MIEFTADELQLITRLSITGGWDSDEAADLKRKIKTYLLPAANYCCCYCRRSMHQWHGLTIDTEHVLPKGKFPQYTFRMENLNISCKRCNMGIKREDIKFYIGAETDPEPFKSEHYRIIHPNCDAVEDHLAFLSFQFNTKLMVKYQIIRGSLKGSETYRYFELSKLEINSFDEAQGLEAVTPSNALPPEFAKELNAVLDTIQGI